jgi:hypothetical protein
MIIEATIINGKFKGEDVLLPRIPMIPSDDHRSYNYKWKIQRRRCTVATHSKIPSFAISCATCFCNDHRQSTRTSLQMWTKFGKSMLFTWTTVCSLLTRWITFRFIRVHTRKKNKKYCIFKSSSIKHNKTKYRVSSKLKLGA